MRESYYHNPLILRVQRHAGMATLFPAPAFSSVTVQRASVPWVTAVAVQDSSISSVNEPVISNDLSSPALPVQNTQPAAITTVKLPSGNTAGPVAKATPPRSLEMAGTRHDANRQQVQRNPAITNHPSQTTVTSTTTTDSNEDANWRRLQAIYRKHQQKAEMSAEITDSQKVKLSENKVSDANAKENLPEQQEYGSEAISSPTKENPGVMASTVMRSSPVSQSSPSIRQGERFTIVELPQKGNKGKSVQRIAQEAGVETNRSAIQQVSTETGLPMPTEDVVEAQGEAIGVFVARSLGTDLPSELQDSGNKEPNPQSVRESGPTRSLVQEQTLSTPQSGIENRTVQLSSESLQHHTTTNKVEESEVVTPSLFQKQSTPLQPKVESIDSTHAPLGTEAQSLQKSSDSIVSNVPDSKSTPMALATIPSLSDDDLTMKEKGVGGLAEPSIVHTQAKERYLTRSNPMPLQEVWPVQRKSPKEVTELGSGSEKSGTNLPQVLAPIPDQTVQSMLQAKPTGQPTASAVELLAPRNPRPQLQRDPKPDSAMSANLSSPPMEMAVVSSESSTPRMVETEIGTLPSDLWELIGQPVPRQEATSSTSPNIQMSPSNTNAVDSEQTIATQSSQAHELAEPQTNSITNRSTSSSPRESEAQLHLTTYAIESNEDRFNTDANDKLNQGYALTSSQRVFPKFESGDKVQSNTNEAKQSASVIQRQQPISNVSSTNLLSSDSTEPSTTDSDEVMGSTETDIEDLANKVYSNLRRRLAIDWERFTRR